MTLENETVEGRLKEAEAQIKFRDNIIAAMTAERRELQKQIEVACCENADLKRQIASLERSQCQCIPRGC